MKLKYILGITFIVPLLGLILINIFASHLSSFQFSAGNFICLTVLFIGVVDVIFIAFKHHKLKLNKT